MGAARRRRRAGAAAARRADEDDEDAAAARSGRRREPVVRPPRPGGRRARRASRFARPVELGARRSRSPSPSPAGRSPDLSQLRRLLPPGVGPRAARRASSRRFEAYAAPTEHPLYVALGALLGAARRGRRPRARARLPALATRAGVRRPTGSAPRCSAAGRASLAALLRRRQLRRSCSTRCARYVDVPFLALVVWAARARGRARAPRAPPCSRLLRPRGAARGSPGCCGPRPGCSPGCTGCGRARRAGRDASRGRVVGPHARGHRPAAVWALVDLAVTGDPLCSLHATTELADDLGRERGLADVPGAFVSFLGRRRAAAGGAAGVVGARARGAPLGWAALRVPLALLGAGVVTFVGTGALGLSILPRYLTVPAVALCVLAGYALARLHDARRAARSARRRWAAGSAAAAVLGASVLVLAGAVAEPTCATSCASSATRTTTWSRCSTTPRCAPGCAAAR